MGTSFNWRAKEADEVWHDAKPGLVQLVYWSRRTAPDAGTRAEEVLDILSWSRRYNPSVGVTGALLCNQRFFAQYLEGPRSAVLDLFEHHIKIDPRHSAVTLVQQRDKLNRAFSDWSMALVHDDSLGELLLEPLDGKPEELLTREGAGALELLRYLISEQPRRERPGWSGPAGQAGSDGRI